MNINIREMAEQEVNKIFENIKDVEILRLKKNDVVCIELSNELSWDECNRIAKAIKDFLPKGVKRIVTREGIVKDIKIIREEEENNNDYIF